MIALLQRVEKASVSIDGFVKGECGRGLLILLGVLKGDESRDADLLAEKIAKLRIFGDDKGKMNLSVNDIGGGALVVSQFTLAANYSHGNRPDFLNAAPPDSAVPLYEYFTDRLRGLMGADRVQTGEFGADMAVSLVNDGPVTIIMDSEKLKK